MPMTDPRQTERNYGNGVLRDTVSLKPSVSTSTIRQTAAACACWEVCVRERVYCVFVCVLMHDCQAGPACLLCPHITFCVIAPEVAD